MNRVRGSDRAYVLARDGMGTVQSSPIEALTALAEALEARRE